jgi:hypothetical protein
LFETTDLQEDWIGYEKSNYSYLGWQCKFAGPHWFLYAPQSVAMRQTYLRKVTVNWSDSVWVRSQKTELLSSSPANRINMAVRNRRGSIGRWIARSVVKAALNRRLVLEPEVRALYTLQAEQEKIVFIVRGPTLLVKLRR